MRIPYKFSLKDLISAVYINPWLGLVISILISPFKTKFSKEVIVAAMIAFIFSCCAVFYNNNFDSFVNWLLVITLLIFNLNNLSNVNSKIPSTFIADLYIFFGVIFMLYAVSSSIGSASSTRWGLYGGEPNFSGFIFLSYIMIYLSRGFSTKFGIYLFILFILVLISTVSRTFFLSSILLYFFYYFKNNKLLITIAFVGIAISVFFGTYVLPIISKIPILEQSGYTENVIRLISLNDSSTQTRLSIQETWYFAMFESYKSFLFGMPLSEYNFLNETQQVVHNSFVQKTAEYGIIYVIFFMAVAFKYLPLWITYSFFSYALFLHAILSVPWVVAISLLTAASKNR